MSRSNLLISRIESWAFRLPLAAPLDFGAFVARERNYVGVRVHTREGLTADCLAQTRGSPIDVIFAEVIAPLLLGKDALDLDSRNSEVHGALTALECDGAIGRAWSLAEICLQDLRAQAVGWPLWRLLGGHPRPVPVEIVEGYALVGESAEGFAQRLACRASEGYQAIKIEAGHYALGSDILRRLELFRNYAGFGCAIILDFAWGWPSAVARRDLVEGLRDLKVEWLEDTFHRQRIDQYKELKSFSRIPIGCGDESTRPRDVIALIDAEAIDVVRLDATTLGGISCVRQIAGYARSRGLRVSFHERPEVHEHCVFGFDSADHIELFPIDRPFDCAHDVLEEPVIARVRGGMLEPSQEPGTGIRLRASALEKSAWRHADITG